MAGVPLSAWKARLSQRQQALQFAIATEDFSLYHIQRAIEINIAPADPKRDFDASAAPAGAAEKFKEINATALQTQQSGFNGFSNDVEQVKNDPNKPSAEDWQAKLNAKRDALKAQSNAAIDQSFEAASKEIEKMPPSARDSATNVFMVGADLVANAAKVVFDKVKEIVGQVWSFLKGIWDGLKAAVSTVTSFFSNTFGKLFGRNSTVITLPDSGVFEATIAWTGGTSLITAAANIEATRSTLELALQQSGAAKPEYSLLGVTLHQAADKADASLTFEVTKNATELGERLKALIKQQGAGLEVTWSARASSTRGGGSSADKVTDCAFALTWPKSTARENVEASLAYLQGKTSESLAGALGSQAVIHTGPVEGTQYHWSSSVTAIKVPGDKVAEVTKIMESVFQADLGRTAPVPGHPKLLTPEKFKFELISNDNQPNGF